MRPLRLTMTAFGPYARTETVDFEALGRIGLFVVAGANGAGKTTIFDALHYGLYGRLPGRRADYGSIRSDHAADDIECRVVLDFRAHGADWRVERSPAQTRPKRRGTGTIQTPAQASLYRLDDGRPVAITNRLDEVRARCCDLVGLSSRQFERVALLPQGEFSRVLRETSADRRELLRTLFSSDVFADATSLLVEESARFAAAEGVEFDRLDQRQRAAAAEISALIGATIDGPAPELLGAIEDFRRDQLASLAARSEQLAANAAEAAHRRQVGVTTLARIERRAQVLREIEAQERLRSQHEHDVARLQRARAAIPVASQARFRVQAQARLDEACARVDAAHSRLGGNLAMIGLTAPPISPESEDLTALSRILEALGDELTARFPIAEDVRRRTEVTARLTGELRLSANELASLADRRDIAETQLRSVIAELAKLDGSPAPSDCEVALHHRVEEHARRVQLADLDRERDQIIERSAAGADTIAALEESVATAAVAITELADLVARDGSAIARLEEATRRYRAAKQFVATSAELARLHANLDRARADADRLWEAFVAGSAARIAATLVEGEPCAVCGSLDHPAPALARDEGPRMAEVALARERAEQCLTEVRRVEGHIESLQQVDPDIAETMLIDLERLVVEAQSTAVAADAAVELAKRKALAHRDLTRRLGEARASHQAHVRDLQDVDQRRHQLVGALGPLADVSSERLAEAVECADRAWRDAESASTRRRQLGTEREQVLERLDSIGLAHIAAQSRQASLRDQLDSSRQALDHARCRLDAHDQQLRALVGDEARFPSENFDECARAVRRAQERLNELATALARRHDAHDEVRRAELLLGNRLAQSEFSSERDALAAVVEPDLVNALEAQTAAYAATRDRLAGQLSELGDSPELVPDLLELQAIAEAAADASRSANERLITETHQCDRLEHELRSVMAARAERDASASTAQRLERVAAIVKGDNERNISLENWVLAAHLRDVVELANLRLGRVTQQRFQLCVLDDGESRRGKWGLDLGVEDLVTGTRRPTAGLSGGELFQASLALALGLADAVMNQTAGVRIDALFIDEGFGSLDDASVERAIDLLDELRGRGAMVGVITHVPALLEALPRGLTVLSNPTGPGSVIHQAA